MISNPVVLSFRTLQWHNTAAAQDMPPWTCTTLLKTTTEWGNISFPSCSMPMTCCLGQCEFLKVLASPVSVRSVVISHQGPRWFVTWPCVLVADGGPVKRDIFLSCRSRRRSGLSVIHQEQLSLSGAAAVTRSFLFPVLSCHCSPCCDKKPVSVVSVSRCQRDYFLSLVWKKIVMMLSDIPRFLFFLFYS